MVKNKRGWIKIAEATMAIVIILGALAFSYSQVRHNEGRGAEDLAFSILSKISENQSFRADIVGSEEKGRIENYISNESEAKTYKYLFIICSSDEECDVPVINSSTEVFSAERIISSTADRVEPKIIRIYLW